MKTLIGSLLLSIGVVIVSQAAPIKQFSPQIQLDGDLSVDKMRKQNLLIVRKAAEGIGESLPQRVDAYTKLTAVDANGTRLIYTFEVDAGPKSIESMRAKGHLMAPRILSGICRSAQRFMEADITLTYRYLALPSRQEVLRVDANKTKCPESLH